MLFSVLTLAAANGVSEFRGAPDLFSRENLVAWCIVPYDARNRTPEERAEMMARLGIRQFAYDWRDQHLALLDRELGALSRHRIRLTAFWLPSGLEPETDPKIRLILDSLGRRKIKTQLWTSIGLSGSATDDQKLVSSTRAVRWLADEARKIGCKVALYNHGGWFGEPDNQIAVIKAAKRRNVGIVYNFHHGHDHLDSFASLFARMRPYLLALNINGMRKGGPKILPVGQGDRERGMLRIVSESGWRGPVGILGHREEMDAEAALSENIAGLEAITAEMVRQSPKKSP